MSTWTVPRIKEMKGRQKIACLTAADYATAKLIDGAGVQLVLVGDSLAMTVLGYETTLPVTMEEMLHHTAAVARGVTNALVVADMPFMSYQAAVEEALANAGRFLKESNAQAVKIEGGAIRGPLVRAFVANGIPVLGHIGLTPQSVHEMGGYKVQGKVTGEAQALLLDAKELALAGVFGVVLECVPAALAREITDAIPVPTIGIGAGADCDGQILVTNDMLGFRSGISPRFVKQYASIGEQMATAFEEYRKEVEGGLFPSEENCY